MAEGNVHVGMLIRRLSNILDRMSNKAVQEMGMTRSQVNVLGELYGAEDRTLSFSRLKGRLDISQPGAWGLVNRLEAKGMVSTAVDPTDARAKLITLTDAGARTYAEARTYMEDLEATVTVGIDAQDVEHIKDLLRRMYDNCNQGSN